VLSPSVISKKTQWRVAILNPATGENATHVQVVAMENSIRVSCFMSKTGKCLPNKHALTHMHTHTSTHKRHPQYTLNSHIYTLCILAHSHTHTHTHTNMHAVTYILAYTIMHMHLYTHRLTHAHTHIHMHTHSHMLTHKHKYSHINTHTRIHSLSHMYIHSHTYSHSRSCDAVSITFYSFD
jgi:hypothetical protein